MEPKKEDSTNISRKKFLRICGSVIAGGAIVGVSGKLLYNKYGNQEVERKAQAVPQGSKSPYRLLSSIEVPEWIDGFELSGDKVIVAAANGIYVYDRSGNLSQNFAVASKVRDIAVKDETIYLLFPTRIEAYNMEGDLVRDWKACDDHADYCSFAIAGDNLFVTDAGNKAIFKYSTDGSFVSVISSPNDFIIPSYSFGITASNNRIYCSNPGRHQVESYTLDGQYKGAFGKAGGAAGMFCGCCNPVHLTHTSNGEIITSEKGNPRISCYSSDGKFRSVLLDSKALGGGNVAYNVRLDDDKVIVSGKNRISFFQYDGALAEGTDCSLCGLECPLRKNVTI